MSSSTSVADLRQRLIDGPYGLTPKQADNFIKKVKFGADADECWTWLGHRNRKGYGCVRLGGRTVRAHRVSGGVIGKLSALHSCDQPCCVNPIHVREGTHSDNMRDKVTRGRQVRGEMVRNAKLTPSQVIDIRRRYQNGSTQATIADLFGVSPQQVGRIINRQRWSHLPDAA